MLAAMIDPFLAALTRAWATTMIACSLFLAVLAANHFCSGEEYLRDLRQALQETGELPPPDFMGGNADDMIRTYAARGGQTGS
jgi:hypothetical protein